MTAQFLRQSECVITVFTDGLNEFVPEFSEPCITQLKKGVCEIKESLIKS